MFVSARSVTRESKHCRESFDNKRECCVTFGEGRLITIHVPPRMGRHAKSCGKSVGSRMKFKGISKLKREQIRLYETNLVQPSNYGASPYSSS